MLGKPSAGLTQSTIKIGIFTVRSLEIMNVKVLTAVLVLGIATTLGACGGGDDKPAAPSGSPSATASPST
jgi:hypothetical protein